MDGVSNEGICWSLASTSKDGAKEYNRRPAGGAEGSMGGVEVFTRRWHA